MDFIEGHRNLAMTYRGRAGGIQAISLYLMALGWGEKLI